MDWYQRMRAIIVSTIVRDTQRAFWEDVRTGTRRTYSDVYEEIRNEPNVIHEQRMDKLYQVRHFRMEHLLATIAQKYDWAYTSTLLVENHRCYVYVTKGAIGLTQAYIPAIGAMPQPARYRERHAALNDIVRVPRLDLGDEPREVMLGKDFYAILAHNPVGKRFAETDQRLGMIQVCVPTKDMSEWAVELSIEEIIGEYKSEPPSKKPDRRLPWRRRADREDEGKR